MSDSDFGNARSDEACDDETYVDEAPWTGDVVQSLVQLYRDQPSLWNQECSSYTCYWDRRLAYETIHGQLSHLGISVLQVIMKIHEVRKMYVEELKNIAAADLAGTSYEPRFVWFYDLDDFLHSYLHVDEIEELEEIENSNSGCFSSNYCAEDERSTAIVRSRSLADFCESPALSKRSCAFSLPSIQKTKNCGALNCPANVRPKTAQSNVTSLKKAQSDPAGRSIAIVRSLSQPIKTSEQEMEEKSSHSHLTARKSCDEFDLFAKSVACRLKQMSPDAAARAQTEIQRVLTNVVRDMEPNDSKAESENLDLDSLNNCKCSVVSILIHSKTRMCNGQDSKDTVSVIN